MSVQGQTESVRANFAGAEKKMGEASKEMGERTAAQSREAIEQLAAAADHNSKVMKEVATKAASSGQEFNELVLHNILANTRALFDAFQAFTSAKSLPEVAQIQAHFCQAQMAALSEQTKSLTEASTRASQQVGKTIQEATNNKAYQH